MDNSIKMSEMIYNIFGPDEENEIYLSAPIEEYSNVNVIEEDVQVETYIENSVEGAEVEPIMTQEENVNHIVRTSSQTENNVEIEAAITEGINNSDIGPQTGMQYATLDSLFNAYQEHARRVGFSVMKRTGRKVGEDEYKYALFVCCKARKPMSPTASTRIDCKARLNAKRQIDGSWVVSKMCSEHNHELDPQFSILMPAHRSISTHLKRQLEANDRAGIRVSKNIRLAEVQSGGLANMGCLPKDIRNFIDERRRMRLGEGDAEAVRKLFIRLSKLDKKIYHIIDIDEENRLRNVLWIHPRSRAAYEEFNDVVSFDTTYLVNRHKMPFAAVVGVNHHGQSILLGCALVTNEDAKSFKWVFSNWLEAMGGVQPIGIITDQCESIKIALREVMPNTIHRYCIWHIMAKLPIKFKSVPDYNKVINEWKEIVYDSLDIQTFEMKWAEFIISHNLQNNRWLSDLYCEREKWVPVYLNHIFWAGMISTQRSEGMHAYFDEFLHSRCSLVQFMEQYEMAVGSKVQKEFMADFDSRNKNYVCLTRYHWELQFQKVYTNSMFKRVQMAIERMMYCIVTPNEESSQVGVEKYNVLERCILNNTFKKEYTYIVEYRKNGEYLMCNCRNFEFKGILCCHIFEVLRTLNIEKVNDRYTLGRWRKDVHRRCSSIFFAGGYPHMTIEYKKYQETEKIFQELIDLAFGNMERMDLIQRQCMALKTEWQNGNTTTNDNGSERVITEDEGIPILNPRVTKTKGRPTEKRMKSALEKKSGRSRTSKIRDP